MFKNCERLGWITLPVTVREIGNYAFSSAERLKFTLDYSSVLRNVGDGVSKRSNSVPLHACDVLINYCLVNILLICRPSNFANILHRLEFQQLFRELDIMHFMALH